MRAILEILLSFLAVAGLLGLGWLCFARLLRPMGGKQAVTLLPAKEDGEDLEQALTGLFWLRGAGFAVGQVVIVDRGLTRQGLALAQVLAEQEPGVYLCPQEKLGDCVEALWEQKDTENEEAER
ncbi:MAG: hypothetical protein K2F83_03380 [Oscillospiraceae bacterium]|nr:hypothetical protein [Oscillospiraceae bacterium]